MDLTTLRLDDFQKALNDLAKDGTAIAVEQLNENRFRFRWKDLCEQLDLAELTDALRRNQDLIAKPHQRYEVLAKYVATRLLMQELSLNNI